MHQSQKNSNLDTFQEKQEVLQRTIRLLLQREKTCNV